MSYREKRVAAAVLWLWGTELWRSGRGGVRKMERGAAMQREGSNNGGHAAALRGGALGRRVVSTEERGT
jgi:hypothetical protein